jgi:Fe-S-cluster-containing hydrogenase component 2
MVKEGVRYPSRSRIRVIGLANEGCHLPVICQHCQDAPCMAVCPKKAIYRDESLERVMVDYDLCISCKMCVAACPFCFPQALDFIADYRQQYPAVREAASRVRLKLDT